MPLTAIDLFCGMGGFSLGFSPAGFRLSGVDTSSKAGQTFLRNRIGKFVQMDLARQYPDAEADVVLGGPPCRPWSVLNLQKRRGAHPDYQLLGRYFRFVVSRRPICFVMENVRGLASDPAYAKGLRRLRKRGYTVESAVVRYADWGAATARHRLFTFGFQDPAAMAAFTESMMDRQKPPRSVMSVIERFAGVPKQEFPDHVWPELRTIGRYKTKYQTSKFGWYQPAPDRPAPSFGNVAKTYILHPWAGRDGFALRVISIREAMAIMGFPGSFRFPQGFAMRTRYQMVADAVSPVYSRVVARAIWDALE